MLLSLVLSLVSAYPHDPSGFNKPAGAAHFSSTKGPATASKFPAALQQQTLVKQLIGAIDKDKVKSHLVRLTEFPERYYQSPNGVKAAQWLYDQVVALNASASPDVLLTVRLFQHSWKQPSVIARLEPRNPAGATDIVITGTHFDTIGSGSGKPEPNPNPAADDCASGSSVIAETLRVLVNQKFVPKRPIEIHWYAAEEVGLLGSDAVAEDYAKRKVGVFSYLNLDQSGYVKPGTQPTIGILTDYVSKAATEFLRLTLKTYTNIKVVADNQRCGYRCTDNASWYDHGYNAALASEAAFRDSFPYNDKVNSDGSPLDTVDNIDFDHIVEFVRNTLGFVVELSLA